jgi:hypothetical protein
MKSAGRLMSSTILYLTSTLTASAQTPDDVLKASDVCTVALSVLDHRLLEARTAEQRSAAATEAKNWKCYNAAPGHPTLEEKRNYIARISKYAEDAEKKFNVPAAVIAAMALVESGYGFTRTAQYAHNLFGWKASKLGVSKHYVLPCQDTLGEYGDADDNRCYLIFDSEQSSVDHVAGRLAAGFTANYKNALSRYRRETTAGVPVVQRTQNYVAGIARPYNWQPVRYAHNICRFMRDPIRGSGQLDDDQNLYRLSAKEGEEVTLESIPSPQRSCDDISVPPN